MRPIAIRLLLIVALPSLAAHALQQQSNVPQPHDEPVRQAALPGGRSADAGSNSPSEPAPQTKAPTQAAQIPPPFTTVHSRVEVHADDPGGFEALAPAFHISQMEIQSAAGTMGDFTRYLQLLPGVTWNSDLSNEVLVRGGHPLENLFVVDGIEVPNLNHFSLSGSNGGFTSMIDSSTIGSVDLRAGVYDANYASRMSSLIQVHTRPLGDVVRAGEFTFGDSGVGGFYQTRLSRNADILVSGHRSIVNFITSDIGINGSPIYSNALAQLDWSPTPHDQVSVLSLSGVDSISMHPCPGDNLVTSTVQTQYSGWRNTEGLSWSHLFSPHLNSKLTASSYTDAEDIGQQYQVGVDPSSVCNAASLLPVYKQNTRDGLTILNYQLQGVAHGWLITAGASGRLASPDDQIAQPAGEPSPFSTDPNWSDSINISRRLYSSQSAEFIEIEGDLTERVRVLAALRAESFAIDHSHTVDPRASVAYRVSQNLSLHGSFGIASQLPPIIDLLSYAQNRLLQPAQVRQASVGLRLFHAGWGTLDAEYYEKRYRREAVSTEYPQLALSNMIDTLGEWFVWLPLASRGTASAHGLELSLRTQMHNRFQLLNSATWARTSYRALDGIQRRGSFDLPLVFNSMLNLRVYKALYFDTRETFTSGRPYTPFNLPLSLQQNRGIYDLDQVNALRAPIYNRLDMEMGIRFRAGKGMLDFHGGADNILNRHNVLGYVWLPNCQASPECTVSQDPVSILPQTTLFPAFSARYIF